LEISKKYLLFNKSDFYDCPLGVEKSLVCWKKQCVEGAFKTRAFRRNFCEEKKAQERFQ